MEEKLYGDRKINLKRGKVGYLSKERDQERGRSNFWFPKLRFRIHWSKGVKLFQVIFNN